MDDYSVRLAMIDYDRITLAQIRHLFGCFSDTTIRDQAHIRQKFERKSTNFASTVEFFEKLGYLRADEGLFVTRQRCLDAQRNDTADLDIREFLVEDFFRPSIAKRIGLVDFFSTFYQTDGGIESWPNSIQRIAFSGLRNLLLELEVITTDYDGVYTVSKACEHLVENLSKHGLTPDGLTKRLDARKLVGEAAEIEALEYERRRLSSAPWLRDSIKHVAIENVSVGYDILSYELTDIHAPRVPRYVEVKAVSNSEPKFYMSRNELEVARKFNIRYQLYLVPYTGQKQFDVDALEIIRDPATVLFDSNDWRHVVETMSFLRANNKSE